jgi:hemerythrin-like metal-binding protein
VVREGLRYFLRRTASHFGYEEELMQDVGYPDLTTHRQRHSEFLDGLHGLQEQLECGGLTPQAVGAFVDAIEARLARHVQEDRRFAEFILGVTPAPPCAGPAAPGRTLQGRV